jgi:hypothetical protein
MFSGMDMNDCMRERRVQFSVGEDRAGEIDTHKIRIDAMTAVESGGISAT